MLRYFAFAWVPTRDQEQRVAADLIAQLRAGTKGWRVAYDTPGLCVLCVGGQPTDCHLLEQQSGVALGAVFKRSRHDAQHAIFDREASTRVAETDGRELIQSYWGSYVAFVKNAHGRTTNIVRSPAGNLPCLMTTIDGVQLFFSYLPDCVALGRAKFSINWQYVTQYLLKLNFTEATGLNEVTALRAGRCVQLRDGRATTLSYWDPRRIVLSQPISNEAEAAEIVRETTLACIDAWASRYRSILHKLSGGLDSSIVLRCLKDARADGATTCITHYGDELNSDERQVARLVARDTACELVEMHIDPCIDLTEALHAHVSEAPERYMPRVLFARLERELARKKEAHAIFSGEKGDEIFMRSSRLIAADYVSERGVDLHLLGVLSHRAEREQISIWKAAREALYNGWFVRKLDVLGERGKVHTLIGDDLLPQVREIMRRQTPWFDSEIYVPLGKQYQIMNSLEPHSYYLPLGEPDDPEPVAPLMSQPLIEACLRIPTYVLAKGGWDRAVARKAFAASLPPEILHRRVKGSMGDLGMRILQHNLPFARDVLLNGALVRTGLLNRPKVEEALSDRPSGVMKGRATIFRYLSAEIWLTLWKQQGVSATA